MLVLLLNKDKTRVFGVSDQTAFIRFFSYKVCAIANGKTASICISSCQSEGLAAIIIKQVIQ